VPTTAEKFAKAVDEDRPTRQAATPPSEVGGPVANAGLPIVVIDPGHGGIDSGATGGDGVLEKDVTLKFAQELARQLKAGGKLQPIMTRETDVFISLRDRVTVGRQNHAALFVSVHADTVRQNYVRGATVYTLSDDASDALAAALAEKENRSDILAGLALEDQPDDVADILFDFARRETRNLSVRFAKTLVNDLRGGVALNGNPWRRAAFMVLKAPEVPSVLLELGYLSNKDDEKRFKSKGWPADEAEKVARAIEAFFDGKVTAGQTGQ
jgi:N-acetylmuramoyl-L-alanine amidase